MHCCAFCASVLFFLYVALHYHYRKTTNIVGLWAFLAACPCNRPPTCILCLCILSKYRYLLG